MSNLRSCANTCATRNTYGFSVTWIVKLKSRFLLCSKVRELLAYRCEVGHFLCIFHVCNYVNMCMCLGHGPGMHYKYNYIHAYAWAPWATTARPGPGNHAHYGAQVSFGSRGTWFGLRRSSGYFLRLSLQYLFSGCVLHKNTMDCSMCLRKVCPQCNTMMHVRRSVCECGHVFQSNV